MDFWQGVRCLCVIQSIEQAENHIQTGTVLFRNNPAPMAISRRDLLVEVNEAFLTKLGYAREEVIGKRFLELGIVADVDKYQQVMEQLQSTGSIRDIKLQVRCKDGKLLHVLFSGDTLNYQGEKCFLSVMVDVTDSVVLAEKREQERKRLELILQSAGVGTWEWNVQTGESTYNERWAEIIGYTLEELEPVDVNTWLTHMHPDDMKQSAIVLQEHFAQKTPYYSYESRMKHKDGSWVWILNSGRVIEWDSQGKPYKMFGTHIDITRLKQAEDELRKSQQRFEVALDCAGVGLWDWDLQTQQMYISPQYKRILGYDAAEGENGYEFWRTRWHPDDVEKIKQAMEAFRQGKTQRFGIAHRLLNKDGNWQWCFARGGMLTDTTGNPSHWMGTLADITALMEEREKNKELERIFAVNPDLLCIADTNATFVKVNQAWTEVLGYPLEELEGARFLNFVHPEDMQATLDATAILAKQEAIVDFVNRYRHQNGSYRYIDWRVQPYGTMLFAAARDITDRIKQEEEMRTNLKIKAAHLELMQLKNISLQELLDKSLEEIIALTGSQIGYIFLYDEDKQEFLLHSWSQRVLDECKLKDQSRLYSLSCVGLWGEAVRQRKEIVINDYDGDIPNKHGYPAGHVPIKKFLSIPVVDRGKIVAVAAVANKKTDYHVEDILNLKMMMNIVWAQGERIKSETQLLKERILFGATIFSLYEGIIATDELGKILVMNEFAERLTGWSRAEAYGEHLSKVFHACDADTKETRLDPVMQVLQSGNPIVAPPNILIIAKDGTEHYIAGSCAPAADSDGKVIGAVLNFRDITAAWLKQKQDEYLRNHDALTGAYNRLFFERKIVEEMEHADRYGAPIAMAILDLDRFKQVNDTWGHPIGDAVLKRTAEIVDELIRTTDFLIRLGGEEFLILMPQTSLSGAMLAAEKIRSRLENNRHPVAGQVTASFGVGERLQAESFAHWYKRVDGALYRAKDSGRNRVVSADEQEKLPVASVQLEWEPKWESGHAGIDEEHRRLLELGNRLIYLSLAGEAVETVEQQLECVLEHVGRHFTNEERVLAAAGYPALKRHTKLHKALAGKALKLKTAYHQGALKPAAFFSFIVDDIIMGHMLAEDVLFFPYIGN